MDNMSTKIGLIGDPHATPEPLAEALANAAEGNLDEGFVFAGSNA